MNLTETILAWTQLVLLLALAVLGLHRGWMVALYLLRRKRLAQRQGAGPAKASQPSPLPSVTVQLPIYNERYVAGRLVRSVADFDYPRDRLKIQVLDDSSDDTTEIVRKTMASLPRDVAIEHVRRGSRVGFKAGALEEGLRRTDSDLVAVFDADFVPPRDFLLQTVSAFADPKIGMVQARWEHLNPRHSLLTTLQSFLLDGHFVVEHVARATSGCFFNFNGTAGLFRRSCIDDAGGWQHDTLTEDMDLSYRAQLRGWRFLYRPDLACPAELPVDMNAFLSQQHRWAKGSLQTARKLLPTILRAPVSWMTKGEAIFHLVGNVGFVLLFVLIAVSLPLQILRYTLGIGTPVLITLAEGWPILLSTLSVLVYYGTAQLCLMRSDWRTWVKLPLVLAIGAGMCVNNSAAVLAAFRREPGEFLRTPKRGDQPGTKALGYISKRGALPLCEIALGLVALSTCLLSLRLGHLWTAVFHGLFTAGLLWVGAGSLISGLCEPEAGSTIGPDRAEPDASLVATR
jgi:cellulose synthase/poly-beta-1,6-N-acetylglucosamine synthase-like glycosyltransferase